MRVVQKRYTVLTRLKQAVSHCDYLKPNTVSVCSRETSKTCWDLVADPTEED